MNTLDQRPIIRAAGAVLWRAARTGRLEVAVIHRPKYGDWSLPKGKLDTGESVPAAAVREVKEETGSSCVLGRFLGEVKYTVPAPGDPTATMPKRVDFFAARALDGRFVPGDEVDALRWLKPKKAREMLTYEHEVSIFDEFAAVDEHPTTTVLLLRHAKAGKRDDWNGDDDLRPLSDVGLAQAEQLRAMAPLFGADRVLSAPRLRCVQTVRGIADDLGVEIQHESQLSEEGYAADPPASLKRLLEVAADGGTPVISSQGGAIPGLVGTLAERDGVDVGEIASKKGSVWLLSFTPGPQPRLLCARYLPPPG